MSSTLIDRFAGYATRLSLAEIPSDAVKAAKRILFDSIATGLGGYQTALGQKTVTFIRDQMPGDQATLLGAGIGTTVEGAALGNGTMIKILGMDDSHRTASHIAAQVVPAALAMAEQGRASGSDLLVAMVAAYDLAVRVGHAVRYAQRQRGLDVKGTVGPLAATVAAGRVARVDADTLAYALGLAADMASGTEQYVYDRGRCDTKDLIAGFAARNGVFAVRLAAHGFFGPRTGLDGDYGFFRAFGEGHADDIFADLGQHFAITTTGFKPHGGCRHTHQAVDAVEQILAQSDLRPEEIERITVGTYRYATQPSFRATADPGTRELAGLSIRVATAVALARHSAWPDDFEAWDDPPVRRLRHITDVEVDPEIDAAYPDKNGCCVTVALADGRTYTGHVPYAKGEPEFAMTDAELCDKFRALTRRILPPGRAEEIYRCCMSLELAPDVRNLLHLVSAGSNGTVIGSGTQLN